MPPVKKAARKKPALKKPPEPEPPGPQPKQPVVTVNSPVAAPLIRGASQGVTGGFLVDGLLAFNVDLTERQVLWLTVALGFGINAVMNLVEKWRGRRLIGAAK